MIEHEEFSVKYITLIQKSRPERSFPAGLMVPVPNDCCSHILFPIIPFGTLLHDSHFQLVGDRLSNGRQSRTASWMFV